MNASAARYPGELPSSAGVLERSEVMEGLLRDDWRFDGLTAGLSDAVDAFTEPGPRPG